MNQIIECPHCGAVTVVPEGEWIDNICGSCSTDMFAAPELEEEEMNTTHEENPAGATNTNGEEKNPPKDSMATAYMHRSAHDNGRSFATWSGEKLPIDDHVTVVLDWDSFVNAAVNGSATFHINRACVESYNDFVYAKQAEEEQREQAAAAHAARERAELLLIKEITGLEVSREDLIAVLAAHIRNGDDYGPIIKAMEAIDALDLQRAGLDSWGDFDEEDEF